MSAQSTKHVTFAPDPDSASWARANPIEEGCTIFANKFGHFLVKLPDASTEDPHKVKLAKEPTGGYTASCDCDGFRYYEKCAHIVTVRKAEFLGYVDVPDLGEAMFSCCPTCDRELEGGDQ